MILGYGYEYDDDDNYDDDDDWEEALCWCRECYNYTWHLILGNGAELCQNCLGL